MKASEWYKQLPTSCVSAQPAILAALLDPSMRMAIEWVGIPISDGNHDAILYVGCDALMVGEPADCVRVNVDCATHQKVCDALGLQMPTARMVDIIYQAAEVRVAPCTFSPDSSNNITIADPATGALRVVSMSSVAAMFAHDARVTKGVSHKYGLVCNFGKSWNLSSKLGPASSQGGWVCANYGWFDPTAPYLSVSGKHKLWQPLSTRHNDVHVDYSQVCWAIHPMMLVDGAPTPTAQVLTSEGLAGLVSHEGALASSRHPSLAPYGLVQEVAAPIESIRLVGQPAPAGNNFGKTLAILAGTLAGMAVAKVIW